MKRVPAILLICLTFLLSGCDYLAKYHFDENDEDLYDELRETGTPTLGVARLVQAYADDPTAAADLYDGEYVIVRGTVQHCHFDWTVEPGWYSTMQWVGDQETDLVLIENGVRLLCLFDEYLWVLETVEDDDTVIVVGSCRGEGPDGLVVVEDCRYLEIE